MAEPRQNRFEGSIHLIPIRLSESRSIGEGSLDPEEGGPIRLSSHGRVSRLRPRVTHPSRSRGPYGRIARLPLSLPFCLQVIGQARGVPLGPGAGKDLRFGCEVASNPAMSALARLGSMLASQRCWLVDVAG